jgi:hypothetical protein
MERKRNPGPGVQPESLSPHFAPLHAGYMARECLSQNLQNQATSVPCAIAEAACAGTPRQESGYNQCRDLAYVARRVL